MWYAAVLSLLILGGGGTDIGQLHPVEVVQLYEKGGLLFLETDTGDKGWGLSTDEALKKLKETTPGIIYLDTADYLLVERGLDREIASLDKHLKKNTRVCYAPESIELQEVVLYLRVHRPESTLKNMEAPLEMLTYEGGRMIMKKF